MNRDVRDFLRELAPDVRGTATALREEIRDLLPDAVEKLHGGWRVIGYSHDGSMKTSICAIAPHPKHVTCSSFTAPRCRIPKDVWKEPESGPGT